MNSINFIFPKNYFLKKKLLGLFDYSTIIFNVLYFLFIFSLINLFIINMNFKIFLIILFFFPIFIFSIIGFKNENFIYIFIIIIKFIKGNKLYLFQK